MRVNSLLVHWRKIEKHQTIQTSAVAHAWHVLPPFLYFSLFIFSLTVSLHWKPPGAQIYSPDNSPLSPTVSFHISFSLNLCVYIYIVAYVFVFILNFIYIYFWSWRSVWVWQKAHELWIFSLRFCRFNELMVI